MPEVIRPSFKIEKMWPDEEIYKHLERCGRTAYKSEKKITADSAVEFITMLISRGHESVLEHDGLSIRFSFDRGISHELVRHRLAAYTQESTRYVNYSKLLMQFIEQDFKNAALYGLWYAHICEVEALYSLMIKRGATPQKARSVLPNSVKTEIVATWNWRETRHVIQQRTAKTAHPQIRFVMCGLLKELKVRVPALFYDIPNPPDVNDVMGYGA